MVRKTERNKELDIRLYKCLHFLFLARALPNHKSTQTLPVRHFVGGNSFIYAIHTNTQALAPLCHLLLFLLFIRLALST